MSALRAAAGVLALALMVACVVMEVVVIRRILARDGEPEALLVVLGIAPIAAITIIVCVALAGAFRGR